MKLKGVKRDEHKIEKERYFSELIKGFYKVMWLKIGITAEAHGKRTGHATGGGGGVHKTKGREGVILQ